MIRRNKAIVQLRKLKHSKQMAQEMLEFSII